MSPLARPPEPPYLVAVFTSQRNPDDRSAYDQASARMAELVVGIDGFLGHESARGADGFGITVSYWRDEAALRRWRDHLEHRQVQGRGKAEWYDRYVLRVGRIERESRRPDARPAHKVQ